jgi:superfamily II DNA/RNA helicase
MKSSSGHARGASLAAIKGLILTPTRELAAQCLGMMTAMAKFTGLRAVLIVGGAKNVKAQVSLIRSVEYTKADNLLRRCNLLPWLISPPLYSQE